MVAIYSTFLQRAYDQILHDVCLDAHHVVFALDRGGIVGSDGPTHHGLFDLSYLRSLPNMVVMAPRDENELRHMMYTAVEHDGPIAFRYPRGTGFGVAMDEDFNKLEIGKAELLKEGGDILLLGIGRSVYDALEAAERLNERGISTTVVDGRFIKPLDADLFCELATRIPLIITIEENVLQGGFGSAVLECLNDAGLQGYTMKRLGIPDTFVEHGSQNVLRSKYGLDTDGIVKAALEMIEQSPRTVSVHKVG